jgi:CubicO group peptidase (beta-lactamase class C family)
LSNVYSITKSVTSALMGIALDEAGIDSLDIPVAGFFPEYFTPFIRPLKRQITIRHCLTMSTGWADWGRFRGHDWRRSIIWGDLQFHPGEKWAYRNGSVHVMAGIVERILRSSLDEIARQRLFEPMQIGRWTWETDEQGHPLGSHGLSLRPQDMAKFGYLYLRGGRWNDLQLVPESWAEESTRFQIERTEPGTQYGYLWWLSRAAGYAMYAAEGIGGQSIVVIPELDLVVVTTADVAVTQPHVGEIIRRFIIRAVLDQPKLQAPSLTDEEGEL